MNLIQLLSNPVKMRTLQFLLVSGEATTKQIAEALPDIPVPTLYRHVNQLIDAGVLEIREERKVRGSSERLLGVNSSKFEESGNISEMAYQFLIMIYNQFYQYDQKPDRDPVRDKLALGTMVLNLTDEEMDSLLAELGPVMEKYIKLSIDADRAGDPGRKRRNYSTIISPTEDM